MRNIVVFLVCTFCLFSCKNDLKHQKSDKIEPSPYPDGVIVILKSSEFSSLFDKGLLNDSNKDNKDFIDIESTKIKDSISSYFNEKDELHVKILNENIYVALESWVYFDGSITQSQVDILNKDTVHVDTLIANIEIQARKAMMQGTAFSEARKPMMQGQWRYNHSLFTSDMIKYAGGGQLITGGGSRTKNLWIVDTGIDSTHQDLVISNQSKQYSISTFEDLPNPFEDGNGHGTFIAGITAGKAFNQTSSGNPNNIGINGIYPGATIVSVRAFRPTGRGSLKNVKAGLDHIGKYLREGDVINLSFGIKTLGSCKWGGMTKSIKNLTLLKAYVVMSAGNEGNPASDNFPGCLNSDYLVTVGSMDNPYLDVTWFSFFSNYGKDVVDYVAPGEYILTTACHNKYNLVSGTSFSAAIVSGIIYAKDTLPDTKGYVPYSLNPNSDIFPIAYWKK